MHLDERLEKSREVIGKQLAVGQKKVSSAFNNLWAEMEAVREAQRKRQEEQRLKRESEPPSPVGDRQGGRCKSSITLSELGDDPDWILVSKAPDLSGAQANIQAASTKAGAYLSSWGAWASEKKKGWQASRSASVTPLSSPSATDPTPGDLKRANDFKREKGTYDGAPLNSARTAPPDVEAGAAASQRESLFFDAEKDKVKEAEKV